MSNVINQNLDEIISIKNQLSNVLIENGVEAGNRFSDYPDMFRSVIASGGSFNPSYYYTADEIDENFVSYSYLSAALEDIDVDVDLDDYVTYSYAYNTFVSYAYLGDLEQISEYILGSGSSSAPENIYATKTELGAYVSKISLQNMAYITMDDVSVMGYMTQADSYVYLSIENFTKPTGIDVLKLLSSGLEINTSGYIYPTWFSYTNLVNGGNYNWIGSGTLKNYVNGRLAAIESSYVTHNYLDNNFIWTGTSAEYAALDNYTTYQIYLIQEA